MTNTDKKPLDIFDFPNLSDKETDIFDICVDYAQVEAHKIMSKRYPDTRFSLGTLSAVFYEEILPIIDILRKQIEVLVDSQENILEMVRNPDSIETKPYTEEPYFISQLRYLVQDCCFQGLIDKGYNIPQKQVYLYDDFSIYSDFKKIVPLLTSLLSSDEIQVLQGGDIEGYVKLDRDTVKANFIGNDDFQNFLDSFLDFYEKNKDEFRKRYLLNQGHGIITQHQLKRSQKLINTFSDARSLVSELIVNTICDTAYIQLQQQGYDIEHVVQLHLGLHTTSPIYIQVRDKLVDIVGEKLAVDDVKQAIKDYNLGEHSSNSIKNISTIIQQQDVIIQVINQFVEYYKENEQEFIDRYLEAEKASEKLQQSQKFKDIINLKHLEK